jgi:hypothetical protein
MSETRPASGASNPIPRFAKTDDGTSSRRAGRAEILRLRANGVRARWWHAEPS